MLRDCLVRDSPMRSKGLAPGPQWIDCALIGNIVLFSSLGNFSPGF